MVLIIHIWYQDGFYMFLPSFLPHVSTIVSALTGSQELVLQSIRSTLRPELLNRLDDIVVFQPLTGPLLRQVGDGDPVRMMNRCYY